MAHADDIALHDTIERILRVIDEDAEAVSHVVACELELLRLDSQRRLAA